MEKIKRIYGTFSKDKSIIKEFKEILREKYKNLEIFKDEKGYYLGIKR